MAKQQKKTALSDTLLKVSWLSVLLGIFMEMLLLGIAYGFNIPLKANAATADLVNKVSWSTIVCIGLSIATAATKMKHRFMGLAGLIAAPIAFQIAKFLHESTAVIMSLALPIVVAPSALMITIVKGIEYATLGYLLGKLSVNMEFSLIKHTLSGLTVGLIFGGFILYLNISMALNPIPIANIVSKGVNEIVFPVGCSLVLFAAQKIGNRSAI